MSAFLFNLNNYYLFYHILANKVVCVAVVALYYCILQMLVNKVVQQFGVMLLAS